MIHPYIRLAFAYLIMACVIIMVVGAVASLTYIPMHANYMRCGSIFLCDGR